MDRPTVESYRQGQERFDRPHDVGLLKLPGRDLILERQEASPVGA